MSDKTGGPAFPCSGALPTSQSGLTKLEWYAGMAMQGIIHWDAVVNGRSTTLIDKKGKDALTRAAFETAEAMLAEAERRQS